MYIGTKPVIGAITFSLLTYFFFGDPFYKIYSKYILFTHISQKKCELYLNFATQNWLMNL